MKKQNNHAQHGGCFLFAGLKLRDGWFREPGPTPPPIGQKDRKCDITWQL